MNMFVEYGNELLQYKKNALNVNTYLLNMNIYLLNMHIYLLNMKVSFLNVNEYRVLNNATNKQPYMTTLQNFLFSKACENSTILNRGIFFFSRKAFDEVFDHVYLRLVTFREKLPSSSSKVVQFRLYFRRILTTKPPEIT